VKTLEVVAAVIRSGEKFLICRRPAHKARGLLWEFPGGKLEPGETHAEAIVRECQEELGVILAVEDVLTELVHEYPDVIVHLTVFNTRIEQGVPQRIEHADLQWITPAQACSYDFCPADIAVVKKLQE